MRDFFPRRLRSVVRFGASGATARFPISSCVFCLVFLSSVALARADDALPTGFKAERYRKLWERNPFTLVTPAAQIQPEAFNKLAVVSWLNEGGKDSLFVQDADTNDVQKITDVPNDKGIRIVEVRAKGGKDFQMIRDFEAVISNGVEQGTIKFKPQEPAPAIADNPMQVQPEGGQNNQIPRQINNQVPGGRVQPNIPGVNQNGNVPGANQNPNIPPQAQQTHRRRVLPSAVANGTPGAVPPRQNPGVNQGPGINQDQ